MNWTVSLSVKIVDNEGGQVFERGFEHRTEDETLIRQLEHRKPLTGLRTMLRKIEKLEDEQNAKQYMVDELAREMKQFYNALELCAEKEPDGRLKAKIDVMRGILLAKGMSGEKFADLLSKAVHADAVHEEGEWLMSMDFRAKR